MSIATANMTVTITESCTLNGSVRGSTTTKTVSSVNDIMERIITCPTSEILLYDTHATNVAGSTFDEDLLAYMRITNKGANTIILRIKNADNDEFAYKLAQDQSFILWSHDMSMNAMTAGTIDIGTGWHNITSVKATSPDNPSDLEYIVATT